jgi:hypothetical protein
MNDLRDSSVSLEAASTTNSFGAWAQRAGAAVLALLVLLAPAIWNGFPLLQYDTGGYIARWYEGYLVPSRSTSFGLFLTAGQALDFWPVVILQSVLTIWIVVLVLRALGLGDRPWRVAAIVAALSLATSLPWLTSILLTDIFAGLSVLALYLLAFHGDRLRRAEKAGLFALIAFSAASHSATFAVLLALIGAGGFAAAVFRSVPVRGLATGGAAVASGALLLLATNFALSGQLAWTPGGYTIPFGRMLQDGIVGKYLDDHCPKARLKLCPYRKELPATADEFLWGGEIFNRLGRFAGLGDEMGLIVRDSLAAYPWLQLKTAAVAAGKQLTLNASGEGVHNKLWHTYGIIERYLPAAVPAMRAARQQRGGISFGVINRIHEPAALIAIVLTFGLVLQALGRRRSLDDLGWLAATAAVALLANAVACGVLSGPHDRYGARLAWIAVLAVAIALARAWMSLTERRDATGLAAASPTRMT